MRGTGKTCYQNARGEPSVVGSGYSIAPASAYLDVPASEYLKVQTRPPVPGVDPSHEKFLVAVFTSGADEPWGIAPMLEAMLSTSEDVDVDDKRRDHPDNFDSPPTSTPHGTPAALIMIIALLAVGSCGLARCVLIITRGPGALRGNSGLRRWLF